MKISIDMGCKVEVKVSNSKFNAFGKECSRARRGRIITLARVDVLD